MREGQDVICVSCGRSGHPMHRLFKTVFKCVRGTNYHMGICEACFHELETVESEQHIEKAQSDAS